MQSAGNESDRAAATVLSEELSGPTFTDVSAQDLQHGSMHASQTTAASRAFVQPLTAAAIITHPQDSHDAQAAVQPTADLSACLAADGGQCAKSKEAGNLDLIVNSSRPSDGNSTAIQDGSQASSIAVNADPGSGLEVQHEPPSDADLEALAVASVCSSSLEELWSDEDGSESDWLDYATPAAQVHSLSPVCGTEVCRDLLIGLTTQNKQITIIKPKTIPFSMCSFQALLSPALCRDGHRLQKVVQQSFRLLAMPSTSLHMLTAPSERKHCGMDHAAHLRPLDTPGQMREDGSERDEAKGDV